MRSRPRAAAAAASLSAVLACSACSANAGDRSVGGPGPGPGPGANGGAGGLALGTGAGGGTSGFTGDSCTGVSQQAEIGLQPADIIWAIDTSGSMAVEVAAVQANMNAFSQQIVASGISTHIVLIAEYPHPFCPPPPFPCLGICVAPPLGSGSCPTFDTNPGAGYWHLNHNVGSANSLTVILDTYPDWKPMLRRNASKTFVVVSDDNQSTAPILSAYDFIQAVGNLDAEMFSEWQFHAIYSYTDCPLAAQPGVVYGDLVSQTGGVSGDLCLQDFVPVFDEIAKGVIAAAKLDCEWEIPPPPDGELLVPGQVNVRYTSSAGKEEDILYVENPADCGSAGGWYYDDPVDPTTVISCPATCDEIRLDDNGKIDVLFGCETVVQPK